MIWLLFGLSLLGFGCLTVVLAVSASRSSRDCRDWLQERQERALALQRQCEKETLLAALHEAEHASMDQQLVEIRALPVYERDESPHA